MKSFRQTVPSDQGQRESRRSADSGNLGKTNYRHTLRNSREWTSSRRMFRMMVAAIAMGGGTTGIYAAEAFAPTTSTSATITPPFRRRPLAIALRSGERRRRGEGHDLGRDRDSDRHYRAIYSVWRGSTATPNRQTEITGISSSTSLQLFFNQRDEDGNFFQKVEKLPKRRARPTNQLLETLRSSDLSLPRRIQLGGDDSSKLSSSLVLRYMTTEDLKTLVPMCINEFCGIDNNPHTTTTTTTTNNTQSSHKPGFRNLIPRWIQDPKQISNLWEKQSFWIIVDGTFRLKLMQGGNNRGFGGGRGRERERERERERDPGNRSVIPNDPVMLVLCEEESTEPAKRKSLWRKPKREAATSRTSDANAHGNANTKANTNTKTKTNDPPKQRLVGMVELSLQPPNADRNPPALPLPRWFKAALARNTLEGSLQGWVTNLLVDDSCRGRGYSKILMAACEGIAKHSWGCRSMYLHADADISSGRIPQSLYEGLGYEAVTGSTRKPRQANAKTLKEEYAWAGVAGKELERFTAIRMVDGVALLCYSKKL
eukprot:CAMPEP_0172388374 /NCGR_PEP_ID=MMETSP1061-20121228/5492_1 /TAXON_ID=37318 /ORGANISM="Pseudo-nitzschia pungens, Strain cf. pungens" /LENGTH=541 /DNA_ID=CAMNT_0013118253 /DNA_START=175 /DNA_END=1800 /DNA_ORIENTATION=+